MDTLFGFGAFAAIPILQGGVLHHPPDAPLIAAANAIGAGAGALAIAVLGPAGPAFLGGGETLAVAAALSATAARARSRATTTTAAAAA